MRSDVVKIKIVMCITNKIVYMLIARWRAKQDFDGA